jgi:hypothetical protein
MMPVLADMNLASYSMGARGSFPGDNVAGGEADHSPPSSARVKNVLSYTSTPQYAFMAWCSVNFNLTLCFILKIIERIPLKIGRGFYSKNSRNIVLVRISTGTTLPAQYNSLLYIRLKSKFIQTQSIFPKAAHRIKTVT